jgi:threonyl-tRNA synthetase
MNSKIREYTMQKVPYLLVVGDKEEASEAVSVRTRGKGDGGSMAFAEFLEKAQVINAEKSVDL